MPIRLRALTTVLLAFTTASASSAESLACTSRDGPGEVAEVECPIPAAPAARMLRFRVDFVGSHDDTVLAMSPTLDGVPLACRDGSTTRRVGEDGEVSLDCAFTVPAGVVTRFAAQVTFHHAQYVGRTLSMQ